MTTLPDFPVLDSPSKCATLCAKYPEKVVGLWATGSPRQNVDVLWRLREELFKLELPVIFFFRESAKPMLGNTLAKQTLSNEDHIYQLDNAKHFRLLNFIEVLVSNDTFLGYEASRYIGAKLVGLPHHAKIANPYFYNYFFDYIVSDTDRLSDFNYSAIPDYLKIHKNSYFTQIVAGHPKIDLIMEERQKNASFLSQPVLLIYPSAINFHRDLQKIDSSTYERIWIDIITYFLKFCPTGIVVLSPPLKDRTHPVMERIKSLFSEDGRVFIDDQNDNKFWMCRATYFITDYSKGFINFCMTAKKPIIRMIYTQVEEAPQHDEWGWTISRPTQFIPLLKEMDSEEASWTERLAEKQKREMPTLGKNFELLGRVIKRIFNNDDDPSWPRMDKGHTTCETSGDMLKIIGIWTKKSPYSLRDLGPALNSLLKYSPVPMAPQIWLLLLRRALLAECDRDSFEDIYQLKIRVDSPASISKYVDIWMDNALTTLPLKQFLGLLRYLMRKFGNKITASLLMTVASNEVSGHHKKRALFFLLMELPRYDKATVAQVNVLAQMMPQHFSRPVLEKLNRFLPLAMKVPLPLRRFGARLLGLKKPLAKKYWQAHRALSS